MQCPKRIGVVLSILATASMGAGMTAATHVIQPAAPGIIYTAHLVSVSRGEGAPFSRLAGRTDWTARVFFAAGRGRVDFVAGNALLKAGDFVLFDSTDAVVVRQASKTYSAIPANFFERLMQPGMSVTVKNIKSSLDTLGPASVIAGQPTKHYRLQQRFVMAIDMGDDADADEDLPGMHTESTTEYWLGHIAGLPTDATSPRIDVPAIAPGHVLGDRDVRQKAAMTLLPKASIALRIVATSKTTFPPVTSVLNTIDTTEISDIKRADIDLSQLVIPDGFTEAHAPGLPEAQPPGGQTADVGAKWRTIPGGRGSAGRPSPRNPK